MAAGDDKLLKLDSPWEKLFKITTTNNITPWNQRNVLFQHTKQNSKYILLYLKQYLCILYYSYNNSLHYEWKKLTISEIKKKRLKEFIQYILY